MTRVVAFLLALSTLFLCSAQKTYVLAVGISDYNEINDLNLCEKDAYAFAYLMQSADADVQLVKGKEATHLAIVSSLRMMLAKAAPSDCVIFYFSGHGYEGGFCCWDMSTKTPSLSQGLSIGKKIDRTRLNSINRYYGGLSYVELQVLFRNCRAGKKLVIADACFSGGLRKGNHINTSVQSARKGELIYFLSSRTDETSLEIPGGDNGLFTTFLLKGLSGDADTDGSNTVTLKELYDYVYENVSSYASKIPHSQHPVIWGKYNSEMPLFQIK